MSRQRVELNRKGCARDVLLWRRYCVKLPSTASDWRHFLHGMLANDLERRLSGCDGRPYNPVVVGLPLGLINVYKRAVPLDANEFFDVHYEACKSMSDGFILAEPKPDSFGFVDGVLMMIDYGN